MAASRHFLLVILVSGFDDKMHINSTSSACIISKNSVLMQWPILTCKQTSVQQTVFISQQLCPQFSAVMLKPWAIFFSLYIAPVHSAVKMSTCMAIDSGGYMYE